MPAGTTSTEPRPSAPLSALAAVADELGLTVKLIGTPAEEDYGGKVHLLDAGVFDDVAAAMMVHAAPDDSVGASSLAIGAWDVTFRGKPSHAALAPWEGVNALDAMTVAHTALGLLRQQLPPGVIVHGIVTDGGQAVNVIPARTSARCEVRARSTEQLAEAWLRVRACFEAGALATGAELELRAHGRDFADLRQDPDMTLAYADALGELGRTATLTARRDDGLHGHGQRLPGHPHHPSHHRLRHGRRQAAHPEFTAYGKSPGADRAVLDGATALALTGADLAVSPGPAGEAARWGATAAAESADGRRGVGQPPFFTAARQVTCRGG